MIENVKETAQKRQMLKIMKNAFVIFYNTKIVILL